MNTPASTASALAGIRERLHNSVNWMASGNLNDSSLSVLLGVADMKQLIQWIDTAEIDKLSNSSIQGASTASAITDESVSRDKAKAVWLAEDDETSEPEAYDRGWKDRAALNAPAAHIWQGVSETPEVEPELCPHCDGTGEQTYMSDGGPDAYEEIGNCEHCGGAQTLAAAHVGVKNMLDRTEKAYREATAIIWHCPGGKTAADRLTQLAEYAIQSDKHAPWLRERLLALADMARVAPRVSADDLAAMVRQLVRALRKAAPDHDVAKRAMDYLKRMGLQGNLLRSDAPERAAVEPSQPAPMVDLVPPATARDRWMYEQGRLAERDPRTPAPTAPTDEVLRLRELAATCYAGLGAECDLPEAWLDALLAASEGKDFSTDRLLPFMPAPAAPSPWQPIESAPKDGTWLLLWEKYSTNPFAGCWGFGGWTVNREHVDTEGVCGGENVVDYVGMPITHWMPLPAPPAALDSSTKGEAS